MALAQGTRQGIGDKAHTTFSRGAGSARGARMTKVGLSQVLFLPQLVPTILIVAFGALVIWSASLTIPEASFPRQLVGIALGVVAAYGMWRFDYRTLSNVSTALLVTVCVLMVLPKVPGLGYSAKGMTGWVRLPLVGLRFQPSELAKLVTILLMASMGAEYNGRIETLRDYLKLCGVLTIPFLLILTQPDLGTGLIVLVYYHWKLDRDIERDYGHDIKPLPGTEHESILKIMRRIFMLSLPVSAASIMLPVVSNLDLMIVPQRLEVAGYSVNEATELFGYLTGMAVPLVNLSCIITASMAMSIVPAISEARALRDMKRVYNQTAASVRISNFVCFPAFVIVFVLATPISSLIYNAPGAGPAVMISAFSIVLLGLHQVSTGILQGLGHPTIPMVNMILAAAAKVILNWELTALPWLGIMGAAWATAADMGVAAIINLFFIYKFIGYRMEIPQLLKTLFAAAVMAVAVYFFYDWTMAWWNIGAISTFGAVFFGCFVYIAVMLLVGGLLEDDLARMPMIGRIGIRILRRIGVFKS